MNSEGEVRIYIAQLARLVNRRKGTIRNWCREDKLPRNLRPQRARDGKGWRYWTPAQVVGIEEWMATRRMLPGSGLSHFDPTPEQVEEFLATLRRDRRAA